MDIATASLYKFHAAGWMLVGAIGLLAAAVPASGGEGGTPTFQTLMLGALGGMVPVAGKYVVDRLTESHKAKTTVEAKRRERINEKRAEAIAGIHERLSIYVDALRGLHLYEASSLTEDQEKRTQGAMGEAGRARRDFEKYFAAHELYLPEPMSSHVQRAGSVLRQALQTHRAMARNADIDGIEKARNVAKRLLQELKHEFRQLLLGKDAALGAQVSAGNAEGVVGRRPGMRRSRRPGRRPSWGRAGTAES